MRGANLQTGEPVQRSLTDQMGQGHRSFQWITDYIIEPAIPFKPLVSGCKTVRMDKDYNSQIFRFRPERMEPFRRQFLTVHTAGDHEASHIQLPYRMDHLLYSQIRMLQDNRSQPNKAIRVCAARIRPLQEAGAA